MPIYSFGVDSPLKFELDRDFADAYNRVTKEFFDAQDRYEEQHGVQWTPPTPIAMNVEKDDLAVFNSFDGILKQALSEFGRPVKEDEMSDDYLIEN